jgi:adenosylhomocysteine nucleosidase
MVDGQRLVYVTGVILAVLMSVTGLGAAQQLEPTPRLAVVSAFAPELQALLAETVVEETHVIHGRTFTLGELAGNDVVLFLSGVSMVNATMTTQLVLDTFNITGILFSGIAGGVNPNLSVGDVTVPARWGQYQEQFFARATIKGWDYGWHDAPFGNYGMMVPQRVEVTSAAGEPDAVEPRFWFPVDRAMLATARRAAENVSLTRCTPENVCLGTGPQLVIGGNGISGSTFVDNARYRAWVWDTFAAQALDMETAAVAHVAYVNEVPYLAFRSLSDLAGGGPGENEINTFFELASANSAALVMEFLTLWAER